MKNPYSKQERFHVGQIKKEQEQTEEHCRKERNKQSLLQLGRKSSGKCGVIKKCQEADRSSNQIKSETVAGKGPGKFWNTRK